jgi:hypothetical protein
MGCRLLGSFVALLSAFATLGCGASAGAGGAVSSSDTSSETSNVATTATGASVGTSVTSSSGVGASSSATGGGPATAAALLALTTQCNQISNGLYKADEGQSAPGDIPICGLTGAVFWKADMDVDCDGKMSTQCSTATDPDYQNQTAASDSNGDPLDAATLPYVVVPLKSTRFNYANNGLALGSVIAVIYNDKVVYAVFGDLGPSTAIGEGSYALAAALGIDPNPSTGGVDSGVTYIAFTGQSAVSTPIEDAAHTTTLGQSLSAALIASGGQ